MTVYIELVFFENFAIDYFLLLSGGKIAYTEAKHPVIASLFGALYAVIMPIFYNTNFFQTFFILAIMCLICFKIRSAKKFLYVITSVSVCAGALFGVTNLFFTNFQAGIFYNDDVLFIVSLLTIGIGAGLSMFSVGVYRLLIPFMRKKHVEENVATLFLENQKLSAFIDSGNSLYYKDIPVVLVNKNFITEIPEKPLLIPYSAIGTKGALIGFFPKSIEISYNNKNFKPRCVIAMCDDDFHKKFDALLHPDIIKECI